MAKKNLKVIDKKHTKHRRGVVYQVKITLEDAPLPIWRRLLISANLPLFLVHKFFQISMGWWDYHLHHFESKGRYFGSTEPPNEDPLLEDETKFTLNDLISVLDESFIYAYDFGDGWEHKVVLENIIFPPGKSDLVAHCVTGRRACPPEDVGGVGGYADFLNVIEDIHHKERNEKLEWAGGDFNADSFDIRSVNLQLELLIEPLLELVKDHEND
jgi:hypothetical protein